MAAQSSSASFFACCQSPQTKSIQILSISSKLPTSAQIWDTFMDSIEPFARHIPYHVGVGNHGASIQSLEIVAKAAASSRRAGSELHSAACVLQPVGTGCGLGGSGGGLDKPTQLPRTVWLTAEYGYERPGATELSQCLSPMLRQASYNPPHRCSHCRVRLRAAQGQPRGAGCVGGAGPLPAGLGQLW